jgi:oxygen-independent coproporphyrinogen-3 oxidase
MAAVGRLPKLAAMTPQNLRLQEISSEPAHADSLLCADQITDLLRKYDRAGPRYTSYPPATQFRTTGPEDYLQALAESAPDAPVSVYIHIPFCRSPCYYCGCNKIITRNRDAVRQYLNHLRKEMALLRLQSVTYKRPVTQLHLGGGTPTFLDNAELTELVHHTSHYFNLVNADSRDYSIEIDPRTVDRARIELIRGLGFNRLSLGIQDFDPAVQRAINREQRVEDVRELVGHIRTRGFSSLNFDLIYGLPLQTLDSIRMTLDKVIALSPDRISYYNYAHLPERFPAQKAIRNEDLPAPGLKLQMLTQIIDTLTDAGYLHIGMDHFVKAGDSLAVAQAEGRLCRNFQGYSIAKAQDLIGLGVSSISNVGSVFAQNAVQLDQYYRALDANQLPIVKGVVSSQEDALRRDIIQQLSCYRTLDIGALEARYHFRFADHFQDALPALSQFEQDGLIERDGWTRLRISARGSLLLRNICMVFDAYLQNTGVLKSVFSRAI